MKHLEDSSLDMAHDDQLQNLENCHCFGDGFGGYFETHAFFTVVLVSSFEDKRAAPKPIAIFQTRVKKLSDTNNGGLLADA